MIFLDSNVPMYLVGAEHPHKADARQLLEAAVADRERLVTDAEVFQEILHRYVAIERRDAIAPAIEVLFSLVDEVFPVEVDDVQIARKLLEETRSLSARDALHLAIMDRHRIDRILTFDRGFDKVARIARIGADSPGRT